MKLKKLIKLVVIEILMDFIELEFESLKFELISRLRFIIDISFDNQSVLPLFISLRKLLHGLETFKINLQIH